MDYKKFLKEVKLRLAEKEFELELQQFIDIDQNYYAKIVTPQELIEIVKEYEVQEEKIHTATKCQVLTIGNPEIVFRLGIEAVRNHLKEVFISINDFCLAQNKFIVAFFHRIFQDSGMKIQLVLDNLTKEETILENGKKYDITISISDSYRYDFYKESISNIIFYPYHIFEVYADEEFQELTKTIFDYSSLNGFELIKYDEGLALEDAVSLMNRDGYGFAAVLLSKDKEKQKVFQKEVLTSNKIINENPLKKIKFELNF